MEYFLLRYKPGYYTNLLDLREECGINDLF